MSITRIAQALTVSALTFVNLSCGEGLAPADEPGNQSNDRVTITNDQAQLDVRVRYVDADVAVVTATAGAMSASGLAAAPSRAFSLRLRAEVLPPAIDGQLLQATAIAMRGDRATVSYNMRGGAIPRRHRRLQYLQQVETQTEVGGAVQRYGHQLGGDRRGERLRGHRNG